MVPKDIPASHAVVSDHAGTACGTSDRRLYIENCNFDSVFDLLNFIHGGILYPPVDPGEATGRLAQFGQGKDSIHCLIYTTRWSVSSDSWVGLGWVDFDVL